MIDLGYEVFRDSPVRIVIPQKLFFIQKDDLDNKIDILLVYLHIFISLQKSNISVRSSETAVDRKNHR